MITVDERSQSAKSEGNPISMVGERGCGKWSKEGQQKKAKRRNLSGKDLKGKKGREDAGKGSWKGWNRMKKRKKHGNNGMEIRRKEESGCVTETWRKLEKAPRDSGRCEQCELHRT